MTIHTIQVNSYCTGTSSNEDHPLTLHPTLERTVTFTIIAPPTQVKFLFKIFRLPFVIHFSRCVHYV